MICPTCSRPFNKLTSKEFTLRGFKRNYTCSFEECPSAFWKLSRNSLELTGKKVTEYYFVLPIHNERLILSGYTQSVKSSYIDLDSSIGTDLSVLPRYVKNDYLHNLGKGSLGFPYQPVDPTDLRASISKILNRFMHFDKIEKTQVMA